MHGPGAPHNPPPPVDDRRALLAGVLFGSLRLGLGGASLGALGGCGLTSGFRLGRADGSSDEASRLAGFLEECFLTDLDRSPTLSDRVGTRPASARWDDRSEAFLRESAALYARDLDRATRAFERGRLDADQQRDAKAFALDRRVRLERIDLRGGLPPLGTGHGPQVEGPLHLLHVHPLRNQEEAELYVQRVAALADELERTARRLAEEPGGDALPPSLALEIAAHCGALTQGPTTSPLRARLERALDVLPGGTPQRRARLLERMAETLDTRLGPAARGLEQALQDLAARAPATERRVPTALQRRAYRAALVRHTTSDLDAAQLHALGVAEVLRVQRDLVQLMGQVDFRGNLPAFLAFARDELPARLGEADLEPSARLARARTALTRLRDQVGLVVARAADAPLELVLHDPSLAPLPSGVLLVPAAEDGSRPARLVLELDAWPSHQLVALLARHGVPGRHLAASTALFRGDLPRTRRHGRWTACDEGWGLYAARLVREQRGMLDPWAELGLLGQELLAAALTVVDTGLHDLGWSRTRALDHLLAETAAPVDVCRRALDGVLSEPGRAPAATLGLTRLLELRQRVRARMGDAFQASAFHAELLHQGSLPLDELDRALLEWAAREA